MAPLLVLHTVDDVIEHLGGKAAVAELTGRGITAVHNWSAYGRFSRGPYKTMIDALAERNAVAPPALWGIEGKLVIPMRGVAHG